MQEFAAEVAKIDSCRVVPQPHIRDVMGRGAEDSGSNENIRIFEDSARVYDRWFDVNRFAYESELVPLRKVIPGKGMGLEIGVGTGRFSVPLGIQVGIEPAKAMAEIARKRGTMTCRAKAEELPFPSGSFDSVVIVVTMCFLQNPTQALQEATRVLNPGGDIVIGMLDPNSPLGKVYQSKKKHSKFYRYATFYSVDQVVGWLKGLKYFDLKICQTVFEIPGRIAAIEPVREGHGKGEFVVIAAKKEREN